MEGLGAGDDGDDFLGDVGVIQQYEVDEPGGAPWWERVGVPAAPPAVEGAPPPPPPPPLPLPDHMRVDPLASAAGAYRWLAQAREGWAPAPAPPVGALNLDAVAQLYHDGVAASLQKPHPRVGPFWDVTIRGMAGTGKTTTFGAAQEASVLRLAHAQAVAGVAAAAAEGAAPVASRSLKLAPTGCAANNLGPEAFTIHSALGISSNDHQAYTALEGEALAAKRREFANVRLVFLDEVSMLGVKMAGMVMLRLLEIFGPRPGNPLLPAVDLIVCGDFGQLCPVLDTPAFAKGWVPAPGGGELPGLAAAHGNPLVLASGVMFFGHITRDSLLLTEVHRQDADQVAFKELLERVRDNTSTEADVELLNTRLVMDPNAPIVTPVLCETRGQCAMYNQLDMERRGTRIVRVLPVDTGIAGKREDYGGLPDSTLLQADAPMMLLLNLWTAAGLFNGLRGTYHYSVSRTEADAREGLVQLAVCSSPKYKGPAYDPAIPNSYPVPWTSREHKRGGGGGGGNNQRGMLPLAPAAAVTIHKMQGQSLDVASAVLSPHGNSVLGLRYVELSRYRRLEGLHLRNRATLAALRSGARTGQRKDFERGMDARQPDAMRALAARLYAGEPAKLAAALAAADAVAARVRAAGGARPPRNDAARDALMDAARLARARVGWRGRPIDGKRWLCAACAPLCVRNAPHPA